MSPPLSRPPHPPRSRLRSQHPRPPRCRHPSQQACRLSTLPRCHQPPISRRSGQHTHLPKIPHRLRRTPRLRTRRLFRHATLLLPRHSASLFPRPPLMRAILMHTVAGTTCKDAAGAMTTVGGLGTPAQVGTRLATLALAVRLATRHGGAAGLQVGGRTTARGTSSPLSGSGSAWAGVLMPA